jgi:hypothetical protein
MNGTIRDDPTFSSAAASASGGFRGDCFHGIGQRLHERRGVEVAFEFLRQW